MKTPTISLEKLFTSSDLREGMLRFGAEDTLSKMCHFPVSVPSSSDVASRLVGAAGAIISIDSLFNDARDVVTGFVDLEIKITLDWAERSFMGSALSVLSYYVPSTPEGAGRNDLPFHELPPDTPVVCDEPILQLLVVPLRPKWARANGSARTILFEEHAGALAERYFGPQGRERHVEALEASWREYLRMVLEEPGVHGPLPDRLVTAIHNRLEEMAGSNLESPQRNEQLVTA